MVRGTSTTSCDPAATSLEVTRCSSTICGGACESDACNCVGGWSCGCRAGCVEGVTKQVSGAFVERSRDERVSKRRLHNWTSAYKRIVNQSVPIQLVFLFEMNYSQLAQACLVTHSNIASFCPLEVVELVEHLGAHRYQQLQWRKLAQTGMPACLQRNCA